MMREEHDLLARRVRLRHQLRRPGPLIRRERGVDVGTIEAEQQPVLVRDRDAARGLGKGRQHDVEVPIAAGVHLVVAVQRALQRFRPLRPDVEEVVLRLPFGAGVVDIAQVQQRVEADRIRLDRL
jgi:hypothetical protein